MFASGSKRSTATPNNHRRGGTAFDDYYFDEQMGQQTEEVRRGAGATDKEEFSLLSGWGGGAQSSRGFRTAMTGGSDDESPTSLASGNNSMFHTVYARSPVRNRDDRYGDTSESALQAATRENDMVRRKQWPARGTVQHQDSDNSVNSTMSHLFQR